MDMNAAISTDKSPMWRRLTMKAGKHFLRWMGEFQAKHSLISTTPVIGTMYSLGCRNWKLLTRTSVLNWMRC